MALTKRKALQRDLYTWEKSEEEWHQKVSEVRLSGSQFQKGTVACFPRILESLKIGGKTIRERLEREEENQGTTCELPAIVGSRGQPFVHCH